MKKCIQMILFLVIPIFASGQEYAISKFALSVNPIGFLQFGPSVSVETGITGNLALNAHVRFPTLGLLSYVVNEDDDGLDELKGFAVGGGAIYFFGENRNKPYAGMLIDYNKFECLYGQYEDWEWEETINSVVLMLNGGYRFRFESGFFINTGVFFGVTINSWDWDYTDSGYGSSDSSERTGTDAQPFGMVEVTFGFEF